MLSILRAASSDAPPPLWGSYFSCTCPPSLFNWESSSGSFSSVWCLVWEKEVDSLWESMGLCFLSVLSDFSTDIFLPAWLQGSVTTPPRVWCCPQLACGVYFQRLPVDSLRVLLFSDGYDAWWLSSSSSHIDVDITRAFGLYMIIPHVFIFWGS